jgi:hypothetical protein
MLDNAINGVLGFFVFSIIASQIFPEFFQKLLAALNDPSNKLLSTLVITMAAIPINAILIGFTSASVGKWIFGVRILDSNSRPIGFVKAIKREVIVWFRGLGLGIPFVTLFTASSAYRTLNKNGVTSWDRDMNLSVSQRPNGLRQVVLSVVGTALLIVVVAALNAL